MRRLYADREEKRVTRGSDITGQDGEQEQLDVNDPNQRSLLMRFACERAIRRPAGCTAAQLANPALHRRRRRGKAYDGALKHEVLERARRSRNSRFTFAAEQVCLVPACAMLRP
jgi:hypothetical protein